MNSGPTLQVGSTGPDVRRLQILFVMTKLLDYTGIDGSFGPQTQDAVKSFQQSSNLTADGVVGQATWNALPADLNTPRLARGSTGSVVSALQKAWQHSAVQTLQPILGLSMGTLARGLNRPCAPIKRSKTL
jgi:peptidoglycan hydrolase-like protein with peptidoglycan-binding domain